MKYVNFLIILKSKVFIFFIEWLTHDSLKYDNLYILLDCYYKKKRLNSVNVKVSYLCARILSDILAISLYRYTLKVRLMPLNS